MRGTLPGTTSFLPESLIIQQLQSLSSGQSKHHRIGRRHASSTCILPFRAQQDLRSRAVRSRTLSLHIQTGFRRHTTTYSSTLGSQAITRASVTTVRLTFRDQKLRFTTFLRKQATRRTNRQSTSLHRPLRTTIAQFTAKKGTSTLQLTTFRALQKTVCSKSPSRHRCLHHLTGACSVFFVLHRSPTVIHCFTSVARHLHLCVNASLLIRTLDRRCLPGRGQATALVLRLTDTTNTRLLLTRDILRRILNGVEITSARCRGCFTGIRQRLAPVVVRRIPGVLIHTCLCGLNTPKKPGK